MIEPSNHLISLGAGFGLGVGLGWPLGLYTASSNIKTIALSATVAKAIVLGIAGGFGAIGVHTLVFGLLSESHSGIILGVAFIGGAVIISSFTLSVSSECEYEELS